MGQEQGAADKMVQGWCPWPRPGRSWGVTAWSGVEARDPNMPYLGVPLYDSLSSDPRFQDLLRRMKFPPQGRPHSWAPFPMGSHDAIPCTHTLLRE
jgi:hypothetical protein